MFTLTDLDLNLANEYHVLELLPVGTFVRIRTTRGGDPQWWYGMKITVPAAHGSPVVIAGGELSDCTARACRDRTVGFVHSDIFCSDSIHLRDEPLVGFLPGEVSDVVVCTDEVTHTVQFGTITAARVGRTVFYADTDKGIGEVARYDQQGTAEQMMAGFANAAKHHQAAA